MNPTATVVVVVVVVSDKVLSLLSIANQLLLFLYLNYLLCYVNYDVMMLNLLYVVPWCPDQYGMVHMKYRDNMSVTKKLLYKYKSVPYFTLNVVILLSMSMLL